MFFPHLSPNACCGSRTSSASPLVPANESLHFLQANAAAIVVGIHGLEDPLVSRLKLLQ